MDCNGPTLHTRSIGNPSIIVSHCHQHNFAESQQLCGAYLSRGFAQLHVLSKKVLLSRYASRPRIFHLYPSLN